METLKAARSWPASRLDGQEGRAGADIIGTLVDEAAAALERRAAHG
jgi:hypothetical protein